MTNANSGELLDDLRILRWAHGGDGVAVPEAGPMAGRVVFVPLTVPGDVVRARLKKRKKRWGRAVLAEVLVPSADRCEPKCRAQAACGGCPWMIGSREAQRRSHLAILRGEAGKQLSWCAETVGERVRLAGCADAAESGYRRRVRLAYRRERGQVLLGYRARGSHSLVPILRCEVAVEAINAALPRLRAAMLDALGPGEGEVTLLAGRDRVAAWVQPARGPGMHLLADTAVVPLGTAEAAMDPRAFVQANERVTNTIIDDVSRIAASALSGRRAVELFAGSGGLTPALWRAGFSVQAYEVDPRAEPIFHHLRQAHGVPAKDGRWHACDLLGLETLTPAPEPGFDLVLLDPPRSGALPLIPWIRACGAAVVIYVSCDVATCLRDLAELCRDGRYEVSSLTGYDMFPHTGHQEVVAVARRAAAG